MDGDSVSIADTELTFLCTSMGRLQRTMTKPLPGKRSAATTPGIAAELAATRSMSEALLLQAIPLEWGNLTCEPTAELLFNTVRIMPPLRDWMANADAKEPTKVASRLELLGWHLAAEQLAARSATGGLLVSVTQREMLDLRLLDVLDEVRDSLDELRPVGVCVHWEWATATPETLRLFKHLRDRGFGVVFDEFSGGGGCIEEMEQVPPDYLIFAPQVIRGVAEQPRRLQRLEIVQATCEARRIETVLPSLTSSDDEAACRQIGIQIAQHCQSFELEPASLAGSFA